MGSFCFLRTEGRYQSFIRQRKDRKRSFCPCGSDNKSYPAPLSVTIPPPRLFSSLCVCVFSRHRHSPAVRFLSFTCLKSTSVKKKRMRCRGDVGHPEVGLRMSTGPHPPPLFIVPDRRFQNLREGGGGRETISIGPGYISVWWF